MRQMFKKHNISFNSANSAIEAIAAFVSSCDQEHKDIDAATGGQLIE